MTSKKKTQSNWKDYAPEPDAYERKNFEDKDGIPRTVLLPKGEKDLKAGIPLSLDLKPLYGHMPESFQKSLYESLHAHGLIEPKDYFAVGAADRFHRAMRDVLKHDFLNVQALAKENSR